ncbi:MAG: hypothetical protein ACKO8Z_16605 [Prosthecobacter sp.]
MSGLDTSSLAWPVPKEQLFKAAQTGMVSTLHGLPGSGFAILSPLSADRTFSQSSQGEPSSRTLCDPSSAIAAFGAEFVAVFAEDAFHEGLAPQHHSIAM